MNNCVCKNTNIRYNTMQYNTKNETILYKFTCSSQKFTNWIFHNHISIFDIVIRQQQIHPAIYSMANSRNEVKRMQSGHIGWQIVNESHRMPITSTQPMAKVKCTETKSMNGEYQKVIVILIKCIPIYADRRCKRAPYHRQEHYDCTHTNNRTVPLAQAITINRRQQHQVIRSIRSRGKSVYPIGGYRRVNRHCWMIRWARSEVVH